MEPNQMSGPTEPRRGPGLCRTGRQDDRVSVSRIHGPVLTMALQAKLAEEVGEVLKHPLHEGEYGDIICVLRDLAQQQGISWLDVLHAEHVKRKAKGSYTDTYSGVVCGYLWASKESRANDN